jgi:murein DD-endopeptidase MepM/ murein hydrolase activator NlpD
MLIPEKQNRVKSIKIPGILFKSLAFLLTISIFLILILSYDYYKILQQVYENKHLSMENRQLKEQIQLFQMKLNTLSEDLKRIHTFEKKLRIITGLDQRDQRIPLKPEDRNDDPGAQGGGNDLENSKDIAPGSKNIPDQSSVAPEIDINDEINKILNFDRISETEDYLQFKRLYEGKIAANLGMEGKYDLSREWTELIQRSFDLSRLYATFDYQFTQIKKVTSSMEVDIHELDQYLLDRESFLRSTPTLLPTPGWITSYFGQRYSPYSGKLKMHEGIDVGAPFGHPIYSPADGVVNFSGVKAGFGKFVQIDHGYGVESLFAHSQSLHVKSGQKIKRGELIARVGSTGYSTGPHLHYEVRVNGIAVDPLYFILE